MQGRGWGGVCILSHLPADAHNLGHHAVVAGTHLVVGEPHYPNPLRIEIRRAPLVVLVGVVVSRAVQLDAQPQRRAVEVEHEGSDALLPPPLPSVCAATPQRPPRAALRRASCSGAATCAGLSVRRRLPLPCCSALSISLLFFRFLTPPPTPPLQGRGERGLLHHDLPAINDIQSFLRRLPVKPATVKAIKLFTFHFFTLH